MGIKVYKKGTTHIEHDVQCEIQVIPVDLFTGVPDGWFLNVEDIDGLQEEGKEEKGQEEEIIAEDTVCLSDYTNEEIRAIAKLNGVNNWHNSRIETLKGKLEQCQEQGNLRLT